MSEVNAEEFRVVNADSFEAMESQLAALREELATYKLAVTRLGGTVKKVAVIAKFNKDAGEDLQQRLADAERRNVELLEMLHMAWDADHVSAENCRRIDAALNPNPEAASQVGHCTFEEPCKCKTDKEKIWCGAWVEDGTNE